MELSPDLGRRVPWIDPPHLPYAGNFRHNVVTFLQQYGRKVNVPGLTGVSAWLVNLHGENCDVKLHVYEERVTENASPVCDQCRIIGWQNHPVSNKKYHFIIPSEVIMEDYSQLPAIIEAHAESRNAATSRLSSLQSRLCSSSSSVPFTAPTTMFDSTTHFLHGAIHSNGYGHLLRMNGKDGGCQKLSGKQLFSVWDSLCILLCAKEVSVEDVSNKHGMLLRVLHAAAYRSSWYGKWGYSFGRAAFGIDAVKYKHAVDAVHKAPLLALMADYEDVDTVVYQIVRNYSYTDDKMLSTLGQLLQAMLALASKPLQRPGPETPAEPSQNDSAGLHALAEACTTLMQPAPAKQKPAKGRGTGSGKQEIPSNLQKTEYLQPFSLTNPNPARYSSARLNQAWQAVSSALQVCLGRWTPRNVLRQLALENMNDNSLVDQIIKSLANTIVELPEKEKYAVYKDVVQGNRTHFFLMEKINGSVSSFEPAETVTSEPRHTFLEDTSSPMDCTPTAADAAQSQEIALSAAKSDTPANVCLQDSCMPETSNPPIPETSNSGIPDAAQPCAPETSNPCILETCSSRIPETSNSAHNHRKRKRSSALPVEPARAELDLETDDAVAALLGLGTEVDLQPSTSTSGCANAENKLCTDLPVFDTKLTDSAEVQHQLNQTALAATSPQQEGSSLVLNKVESDLPAAKVKVEEKVGTAGLDWSGNEEEHAQGQSVNHSASQGSGKHARGLKRELQSLAINGVKSPTPDKLLLRDRLFRSTPLAVSTTSQRSSLIANIKHEDFPSNQEELLAPTPVFMSSPLCRKPRTATRNKPRFPDAVVRDSPSSAKVDVAIPDKLKSVKLGRLTKQLSSTDNSSETRAPTSRQLVSLPLHYKAKATETGMRPGHGMCGAFDPVAACPSAIQPGVQLPPDSAPTAVQEQVQCDLQYLYNNVLRVYRPAEVVAGLGSTSSGTTKVLKLKSFPADIQVLKDTKFFTKDYGGGLQSCRRTEGETDQEGRDTFRLVCQLVLDRPPEPNLPYRLPKYHKKRRLHLPPSEIVEVFPTTTTDQLRLLVRDSFKEVYRMCGKSFQVNQVVVPGIADGQCQIGWQADGLQVQAYCSGLDLEPRWRHAGGGEDWVVACSCGTVDDDGERMIACDACGVWVHMRCFGIPDDHDDPGSFLCKFCSKARK